MIFLEGVKVSNYVQRGKTSTETEEKAGDENFC